ncbi:lamin tail domain-containing protein [bacterium SCSIO 12741]|nr:lamin tail domain-containing protein [bacterium SCSIO 12741]
MKQTFTFFLVFVLFGTTQAQDYSTWITDDWEILKDKSLKEIVLPGSHDAGMSVLTHSTAFSTSCNTQTQVLSIKDQLNAGVRYFDLRPVIYNDTLVDSVVFQWYLGHFDIEYDTIAWVIPIEVAEGSAGESLDTALNAIANFIKDNREPVILELSHYYYTYKEIGIYHLDDANFTDTISLQYPYGSTLSFGHGSQKFMGLLDKIEHYFPEQLRIHSHPDSVFTTALEELLPPNLGQAIIIFDDIDTSNPKKGIYSSMDLNIYNNYSNSDDLTFMVNDQVQKFRDNAHSDSSHLFLLSWTITMSPTDAALGVACINSILDFAYWADEILDDSLEELFDQHIVRPGKVPNIILTDSCTSFTTEACIHLNQLLHKKEHVRLREIHPNPSKSQKRELVTELNQFPFIELTNDDSLAINLKGWKVKVNDTVVHTFSSESKLLPGQALIVSENLNKDYKIPQCAKVVEVSSGSFQFNQASDDLVIYNNLDRAVDRYRYTVSDTSIHASFARPHGVDTFALHNSLGNGDASPGLDEQQQPYLQNCAPLEVSEDKGLSPSPIVVFPNPVKKGESIRLTIPQNNKRSYVVEIYGLNGSLLLKRVLKGNSNEIDLRNLASGMYVLKWNNGLQQGGQRLLITN